MHVCSEVSKGRDAGLCAEYILACLCYVDGGSQVCVAFWLGDFDLYLYGTLSAQIPKTFLSTLLFTRTRQLHQHATPRTAFGLIVDVSYVQGTSLNCVNIGYISLASFRTLWKTTMTPNITLNSGSKLQNEASAYLIANYIVVAALAVGVQ